MTWVRRILLLLKFICGGGGINFDLRREISEKHSHLEAKFLNVLNMNHHKSKIRAVLAFYQIN